MHRFGKYLHLNDKRLARVHRWFEHSGHWALFGGYYIAGVRHFTAYAAGMSELEYPPFALYAYGGAALWAATFIGLGYLLGERWKSVQENIHHYFLGFTILAIVAGLCYFAWRKWLRK